VRVDRLELAWAAGFFDGEGWTNAVGQEDRKTKQPHARLNQADPNGIPQVLTRFWTAIGELGRVGGPYLIEGRRDIYKWEVSSRRDVELLHHLLMPWLGQVKLDEFGRALGRPAAKSRCPNSTAEWLAWCAGVFDGEGWASMWSHRTHVGYLSAELGVGQSSNTGVPEVLVRLQRIVGRGRIYGPYSQEGATMDVYRFKASALADIKAVAASIRPWVSAIKRGDIDLVTAIIQAQPALPRGRHEWGNRKSRCVRGHEYATARVRPYRSRGRDSPPRDSHQCLVCAREQAKARRDAKKKSAADDDRRSISEARVDYLLK